MPGPFDRRECAGVRGQIKRPKVLVEVILATFRLVAGEVIQDQDRLLDCDALLKIAQKLEKVFGVVPRQQLITGEVLHAPPDGAKNACRPPLRVGYVLVWMTLD